MGAAVPILREGELDIITGSAEQTQHYGARLGALLKGGDIICLSGDMGAGKTVFASGIGAGWGAKVPLTSPTYNLINEYRRDQDRIRLCHMDAYRLEGVEELDGVGFDDLIDRRHVLVIEWPERIETALPHDHLWIQLRVLDTGRRNLIMEGHGDRYKKLIQQFRETVFGG
jgi:tRNA threonylcarbamoyladenosine biosynthesis protein TsaE